MFKSFFLGGFECATGFNRHREWIDQIDATRHEEWVTEDYELLRDAGIRSIREGIRWPLIDLGDDFDLSSVEPFVEAAGECEMEVIWDLFHFGYPAELDPLDSERFAARFAEYCGAIGEYISRNLPGPHYFTPVNEPSFLSWAGGDSALFAPHLTGRGWDLKRSLCRAAIRGIEALWESVPGCRIVNVDPLCRITRPYDRPDLAQAVYEFNHRTVFESWDIIAGRRCPELGGSPRHLDIVGINYYSINQWSLEENGPLADDDPRRVGLQTLVRSVYDRYGADMLISETSHAGEQRPAWLHSSARDAIRLRQDGLPLHGICLYPVLGMPEWHDRAVWSRYGIWDIDHTDGYHRMVHEPTMQALQSAQAMVGEAVLSLDGAPGDAPIGGRADLAAASQSGSARVAL